MENNMNNNVNDNVNSITDTVNTENGNYSNSQNREAFNGDGFYSSSRHAGYNSQTGYTSAYSGMNNMSSSENNSNSENSDNSEMNGSMEHMSNSEMNNNIGNMYHSQGGTYYNQPQNNGYTGYTKSQKEIKREEKLIKQAKKKAEKKSRKENKSSGSGNGGRHTGRSFATLIAAAVIFGLVAGCVFQGVRYGSDYFIDKNSDDTAVDETTTESGSTSVTTTSSTVSTVYDVATVAEKVMPSIVSITGTYVTTYQYWYNTYEEESSGAGSGVIIAEDDDYLYILTNYHVVEDSKELTVGFVDDESATATIKGYDSANDVAIVVVPMSDISNNTLNEISVITVGSSDDLSVGDPCVAIGNALGYGQSVTVGYVSALNREISVDDGTITVLQTDAAINPGNSGGALVNMSGELIGLNTAKYVDSEVEGMGYAIPISNVLNIVDDLISGQTTGNAYLGVSVQDITEEYSQGLNMPEGVYVYSVTDNSPAEKCGLVTGDIIVAIDGDEVLDGSTLQEKISQCSVGDEIEITFYRNENGQYVKKTATATLELKS